MSTRRTSARLAASAAFLAAFTVAVLIVRSGLSEDETRPPGATPTATQPGTTATTGTTTQTGTQPATTAVEPEFYVIEEGDTLETVAAAQGTTVEQLLVLNPDVDPVALTIGQRIRVK